ncbi:MAG: hypothetical protein DRP56_01175 [Planctomycetota bacterium]|nr:MAG: hypothetical protein DRP56_01175 [Planctomycetota bacterium]
MRLHHIAYVCNDVDKKAESMKQLLNARCLGVSVVDEFQGVKILFVQLEDGTKIELLEPYGDNSPVQRFLDKGGGLYHLCFEVDDLEMTLEKITQNGKAMVVKPPLSAPAINNRRVAFVVIDQNELIEFVE